MVFTNRQKMWSCKTTAERSNRSIFGMGTESVVISKKRDPESIVKYSFVTNGGQTRFQQLVFESKRPNPFFPIITRFKRWSWGSVSVSERLYPLQSICIQDEIQFEAWLSTIFGEYAWEVMSHFPKETNLYDMRLSYNTYACSTITRIICKLIREGQWEDLVQSESFLEAVTNVRDLRNSSGGIYDLHQGNFMIRKDGHLVINDPLI